MESAAITAATNHFLQFRIQYASIALLYWDYTLTLRREIKYMWTVSSLSKVSTVLYVLCRYALLANILYLLAIGGRLGEHCNTWYKFVGAISVLGRAAVITTFTMRTYAVWSQSKIVLAILGLIGLTCFILDCLHVPGLKCTGGSSIQIANTLLSILVCVFEFLATSLTLLRCVQALKTGGSRRSQKGTFHYLVAEQGVLYFGIVFAFTTAAAVLNFKAANGFPQRLLNALTLPLSGLLTARFLLHIREWGSRSTVYGNDSGNFGHNNPEDLSSSDRHQVSTLRAAERAIVNEFGEDPTTVSMEMAAVSDSNTDGPLDVEKDAAWKGKRRTRDKQVESASPTRSNSSGRSGEESLEARRDDARHQTERYSEDANSRSGRTGSEVGCNGNGYVDLQMGAEQAVTFSSNKMAKSAPPVAQVGSDAKGGAGCSRWALD